MSDKFLRRASEEIKRTTREAQGIHLTDVEDAVKSALDEGLDPLLTDLLSFYLLNRDIELKERARQLQLEEDLHIEAEDVLQKMNASQIVEVKGTLYHAISEALLKLELPRRIDEWIEGESVELSDEPF